MNAIGIFNEDAGTAAQSDAVTESSLRETFSAAGIALDLVFAAPDRIADTIRTAAAKNPPALFVGGGDGTISCAAGILAGTRVPLGVIPLGTLNHFAKDLGLPPDWRDAIAALSAARPHDVDLAEVNGRIFVNNCSVGAYADAVRHREALREQRIHGKWLAMFIGSLRVFRRLRRLRFQLETDSGDLHLRSPFLLVANNRYDGNILAQSLRDRIDGGQLWLYSTRAHRHFAILRMVWQALRRNLAAAEKLDSHPCTVATVHTVAPSIPVALDGEILTLETPLRFRLRPGALRVLSPHPPENASA